MLRSLIGVAGSRRVGTFLAPHREKRAATSNNIQLDGSRSIDGTNRQALTSRHSQNSCMNQFRDEMINSIATASQTFTIQAVLARRSSNDSAHRRTACPT
jgi:hypothetical protein